jgi:hypothetical protein
MRNGATVMAHYLHGQPVRWLYNGVSVVSTCNQDERGAPLGGVVAVRASVKAVKLGGGGDRQGPAGVRMSTLMVAL